LLEAGEIVAEHLHRFIAARFAQPSD